MQELCAEHSGHESKLDAYGKRLDSHSRQLDMITETLAGVKEIEKQNQTRIDRVEQHLAEVEAKPGRRWESFVEKTIYVVLAAVLGYALGVIGL